MGIFASKKEIGPDTVIQRNKDIPFNQIDGEVVMLSVENGEYYGMNKIGSRIWKMVEEPISIKELIKRLIVEYKVSEDQCKKDTLDFISTILKKNIIIII